MKARYDLGDYLTGYDFFSWLVLVQAKGATEIVFDNRRMKHYKWPLEICQRRFETLLLPGPALAGMPSSIGVEGDAMAHPDMSYLVEFARRGGRIKKMRSVLPPAGERYTVTLRRTTRADDCNSNEPAWREFAAEIGARVIEDYDVQPMGLHEQVALYAGAEMNFFVVNGPGGLTALTDYPMMMFVPPGRHGVLKKCGIAVGQQLPWMGPNQFLIWEPDELPVLRKHFAAWKETGKPA